MKIFSKKTVGGALLAIINLFISRLFNYDLVSKKRAPIQQALSLLLLDNHYAFTIETF